MHRIRIAQVVIALASSSSLALAQPAADAETPPAPPPPAPEPAKPVEPAPPPAPVVAPPAATPAVADTEQQEAPLAASGFAIEIRLDAAQQLISNDVALPVTQGGIFLGYRGESLTIGIGFDLGRISETRDDSGAGGGSSDQSLTTLLVVPGLRFAMARSTDRKTELLGQLDVGFGETWQSSSDSAMDPPGITRLRVQVAPAIRHWLSQSFAVGASAGVRYDRMSRTTDNGLGGSSDMSLSNTGLFGSLQATAVF